MARVATENTFVLEVQVGLGISNTFPRLHRPKVAALSGEAEGWTKAPVTELSLQRSPTEASHYLGFPSLHFRKLSRALGCEGQGQVGLP